MEYPVSKLEACLHRDLPANTPVINANSVSYFIWLHVPTDIARDFVIYQLDELVPNKGEIDFINMIEQEHHEPWYKITSSILNVAPGQHVYKLSFVNRYTNDVVDLYFSYIIQDDNPDKPYIYMNRGTLNAK